MFEKCNFRFIFFTAAYHPYIIKEKTGKGWMVMVYREEQLRREAEQIIARKKPIMEEKADLICLLLEHGELLTQQDALFVTHLKHYDIMQAHRKELRRHHLRDCNPDTADLLNLLNHSGTANPGVDSGHIGPDWDLLMKCGVPGVLARLEEYRAKNPGKEDFYDPCIRVYKAIVACFARWAEEAKAVGNSFAAENMAALAAGAPQNLAQAMQLTLVFYRLQMDLDVTAVRSLGGLDHLYQPFYEKEADARARELSRAFLLTVNAQHAAANLPFYICDCDGNSWPYTWVLLEEYRALGLYDPKWHVMYHPNLDRKLVRFVLDCIREGKSSFVFINTDVSRKALEHIGIEPKDAKRLTVYGCYEVAAEGTEVPCTCGSYVNMAKAVELALTGGYDLLTGKLIGTEAGTEFDSFEAFVAAVKLQLTAILEKTMAVLRVTDRLMHDICPSLFMSPTYESSITSGVELYAKGGAKYGNTSLPAVGIATLVDSLLAVKNVVFDRKLVTLAALTETLKNNWADAEKLRLICKNTGAKYGNNDPVADSLAVEFVDLAAGMVNGTPNGRGGVFRWGQFSVNIRSTFGKKCAATPDGRMEGEDLSKNAVAAIGQDKGGVTALLASVLKLRADRIPDGCVADVVLHSSAVKGEEGMAAFEALLTTFMTCGGGSIHFNVLSPEVLLKAQAEPEKYKNLQIRLCGWNVRFVNLSKQEQDEFILQAAQENGL